MDTYTAQWLQGPMNPRMLLWLRAVKRPVEDLQEPYWTLGEQTNRWTYFYSRWIVACWEEWASALGFKREYGDPAHVRALLGGHTPREFDSWLESKVASS